MKPFQFAIYLTFTLYQSALATMTPPPSCPAGDFNWWTNLAGGAGTDGLCSTAISFATDTHQVELDFFTSSCTSQGGSAVLGNSRYNIGESIETSNTFGAAQCSAISSFYHHSLLQYVVCCGAAPNPLATVPPSPSSPAKDICKFFNGPNSVPTIGWEQTRNIIEEMTAQTCDQAMAMSETSYNSKLVNLHDKCVKEGGTTTELYYVVNGNCSTLAPSGFNQHSRMGEMVCCQEASSSPVRVAIPNSSFPQIYPAPSAIPPR